MSGYDAMSPRELTEELRRLRSQAELPSLPDVGMDEEAAQRLIHALQVHQVELEIQNHELREAQDVIEASQSRYADLYERAPVGYCSLDRAGHILEINMTGARLLGGERVRLVGRPLLSYVGREDVASFNARLRASFETDSEMTTDVRLAVSSQEEVHVQLGMCRDMRDDITDESVRVTLTDISQRRRSENALRFLSRASDLLASSLQCGDTLPQLAQLACGVLGDICIIRWSRRAVGPPELIVAHRNPALASYVEHAWAAVDPDPVPWGARPGQTLLWPEEGEPDRSVSGGLRVFMQRIGGSACIAVPLRVHGRLAGHALFITLRGRQRFGHIDRMLAEDTVHRACMAIEHALMYEEARVAVRSREEVLAIVSHDLGNPLGAVIMNAELLLNGRENIAPRQLRLGEALLRAATRMEHLLRDLTDTFRFESGNFGVACVAHNLGALLADATEAHERAAQQHGLSFTVEAPAPNVAVLCDPDRLQQVFANIVGNAIKYTPTGGTVRVGARAAARTVQFWVDDTGPGMTPEQQNRVFERYWRGHDAVKMRGAGLGLFIAKRLVEAQGGHIGVTSKRGEGSHFWFELPRQQVTEEFITGRQVSDAGVLVVDDDTDAADALRMALEHEGCRVVCAAHGAAALSYLRSVAALPRVILLDWNMPVMDGETFMTERDRDSDLRGIPVIIVSGSQAPPQHAGASAFIPKPFHIDRVVKTLAPFLS